MASDYAYIAFAQCGHIVAATWADDPKRTGKTVAGWISRGDTVSRVDGDTVRAGKAGEWCSCGKEERQRMRESPDAR